MSTRQLLVEIPSVPMSANNLYVNNPKTNGRYLKKEAKEWKAQAIEIIKTQALDQGFFRAPKTELEVFVVIYHPQILRFDIAGKEKLILDAIAEATGIDDRYVMDLHLTKRKGEPLTAVRIMVE